MQSLHRGLYKKLGQQLKGKRKDQEPRTLEQSRGLLHQRNVAFTTITILVSVIVTLMASVTNVQTQKSELKLPFPSRITDECHSALNTRNDT